MFDSAFERRVKDLAKRANLKVAETKSASAILTFTVGSHTQPLFILDYSGIWEFSCPSIIAMENAFDIPHAIVLVVLERNSKNKRGFWCIETLNQKKTLEYMHNIRHDLLTPEEFSDICWGIVKEVETVENAFREYLLRL